MPSVQYPKYEKKLIAYFDILGFKDMVEGDERKSEAELCNIQDLIWQRLNKEYFSVPPGSNLQLLDLKRYYTTFSDCAVVSRSMENNFNELRDLITDICSLQRELIEFYGVLLRGGISYGNAVHARNGQYLFGAAVNEAVKLGEKIAKNPRIIITEETIQKCKKADNILGKSVDNIEEIIKKILSKDTDGYWFINYFKHLNVQEYEITGSDGKIILKKGNKKFSDEHYLNKIKEMINYGKLNPNDSISSKYNWMEKYFNH